MDAFKSFSLQEKNAVLSALYEIMGVDGRVDDKEKVFLCEVIKAFKINDQEKEEAKKMDSVSRSQILRKMTPEAQQDGLRLMAQMVKTDHEYHHKEIELLFSICVKADILLPEEVYKMIIETLIKSRDSSEKNTPQPITDNKSNKELSEKITIPKGLLNAMQNEYINGKTHPYKWVKIASRNKKISNKALFDFCELMSYFKGKNTSEKVDFINHNFSLTREIKSSDFNRCVKSEFYNELEILVKRYVS